MPKRTALEAPDGETARDAVRHGFAPEPAAAGSGSGAPPLTEVAAQLVEDLRAAAASEIALIEARAAMAGDGVRRAAMWGAVAGGTLLIAVLAGVFGVIMALTPLVGAIAATLIVATALLALAAAAALLARRGARDVKLAFAERGDDVHWGDKP